MTRQYDVFLSHNSADKPLVEILAQRLRDETRLRLFLDKWHLVPGNPWQEELEVAINDSHTCAVFIGKSGIGPWHNEEMRSALDERVKQPSFRVIPVLLPDATLPERGQLPRFLRRLTWVDFRVPHGVRDESAFRRLVAGIKGIPPEAETGNVTSHECPYRGLEVFDEAHARFFFGREADIQHLVETFRTQSFLAVLGPSGSGKSSLVRAGLLPRFRAGALPLSDQWRYLLFKPGHRPVEELALQLVKLQPDLEMANLLTRLGADERALHWQARLVLPAQQDLERVRLCVVVDQFEEIFTLCQDRTEREKFINLLRYAATVLGGRTLVTLTMRADFVAQAAAYPLLGELLSGHQFVISPMDEEDLREAVERPAQLLGLQFDEGLVAQIVQETKERPGGLPLMEDALLELWKQRTSTYRMTWEVYRELGGVQGALTKKAEELFAQFSPEQQQVTQRILMRLVQPGEGTENTRRRAQRSELATTLDDTETVNAVLKKLTDARLLVMDEGQVDVAHEALIQGWPRLRQWIGKDPEAVRLHRRVNTATQEWERLAHDEGILFRGVLLAQAEEWRKQHEKELNTSERAFLEASRVLKQREEEEKRAQEQREKERLEAVAEAERQRANEAELRAKAEEERTIAEQQRAEEQQRRAEAEEQRAAEQARLAQAEKERAEAQQQRAEDQAQTARRFKYVAVALTTLLIVAIGAAKLARDQYRRSQELLAQNYWSNAINENIRGDWLKASHYFARSIKGMYQVSHVRDAMLGILGYQKTSFLAADLKHDGAVWGALFNPEGTLVLTWSGNGTARLWKASDGTPVGQPLKHDGAVWGALFNSEGTFVLTWSGDKTARLWKASDGTPVGQPLEHDDGVWGALFNSEGTLVLTWSGDKTARLWKASDGTLVGQPLKHDDGVWGALFNSEGTLVLTWSGDKTARLWKASDGTLVGQPLKHDDGVLGALFNSEGSLVLTWSLDKTVRLWKASDSTPVGQPLKHDGAVEGALFNPEGSLVLTWSRDKTARLWKVSDGTPVGQPLKHDDGVLGALFNPEGTLALTWSGDKTARLWKASDGTPVGQPLKHDGAVEGALFNPEGTLVLTWGLDKTVRIWNINADVDFPHESVPLLVEVMTGTQMDDAGNVTSLKPDEWQRRKQTYITAASQHLTTCRYRNVNLYLRQKEVWGERLSSLTPQ